MKSIVEFPNKKLELLRGVLHTPDEIDCNGRKDIVIFPNSGLMGAEGDYRSHYRIAEYIVKKGYYVLRFNPSGIGLSDGYIDDCRARDLFGAIETGLFEDDIKEAVRFVSSYDSFTSITLSGICGGGISSLLAAARIDEVECVIPISTPVVLDCDEVQYDSRISDKSAKLILSTYWHKLSSFKAWCRLLTFQSEWDKIYRALINYFKKDLSYIKNNEPDRLHYNQYFHESVNHLLSKRKKILFIFGDADAFWWEFEDLFLNKYYHDQANREFDYSLVSSGNHMLSWVEMQMNSAEKICQWLNTQCGKSV